MELEAGKSYRTANGRVIGPMREVLEPTEDRYFIVTGLTDGFAGIWNPDGTANFFGDEEEYPEFNNHYRLVGEVK